MIPDVVSVQLVGMSLKGELSEEVRLASELFLGKRTFVSVSLSLSLSSLCFCCTGGLVLHSVLNNARACQSIATTPRTGITHQNLAFRQPYKHAHLARF